MKIKEKVFKLWPYLCVLILVIGVLCFLYNGVDLQRPLIYKGDGISATYLMKTIDETGWYRYNDRVGGIFGSDWSDYTMCDSLSFFIVKIISLFSDNCFWIYNMFFFVNYIFVAIASLWTLRKLKIHNYLAIMFSLLYAFLTYHQLRMAHIWLTPYFMVPITILFSIWIASDEYGIDNLNFKNLFKDKKVILTFILLFFSAFTGLYYAFFACCLICIATVISILKKFSWKKIRFSILSIVSVFLGILVNVYPSFIYWMKEGTNPNSELAIRNMADSEIYGMKLIQLLLPRGNHRINFMANLYNRYSTSYPLVNENSTSSLGLVACIGFIVLLILLFRNKETVKYENELKFLNIGVLLVATIGGVGGVFSFFINTPMRSYNRMSIYIAFLSFIYLGIYLTQYISKKEIKNITKKSKKSKTKKNYSLGLLICCIIVGILGILDQTANYTKQLQEIEDADFDNDKNFVSLIEQSVPEDSMIFQLPYTRFPSGGQYELFKGYMHSKKLIWNYGSMQGREEDNWELSIVNLPVNDFLQHISFGGYSGLYIDKQLFEERMGDFSTYQDQIVQILGTTPIVSENGRLYFYDMRGYIEQLKATYGEDTFNILCQQEYESVTK